MYDQTSTQQKAVRDRRWPKETSYSLSSDDIWRREVCCVVSWNGEG